VVPNEQRGSEYPVTIEAPGDIVTAQWRDLLLQEQQLFRCVALRTIPKLLVCLLLSASLIVVARSQNALVYEYIFAATVALAIPLTLQSGRSLYQLWQQMRVAKAMIRNCETVEGS
jgi:hypothetical protein